MVGWVGGVCKVILLSNPTVVLRLGWGFDKIKDPKVKVDMTHRKHASFML